MSADDDLEAEQRAAEAEVQRIENDLAHAEQAREELERETPATSDEVPVWESGMRMVEADIAGLGDDLREAEGVLDRILDRRQEAWGQEEQDEQEDSDDGWPIDPHGPAG